MSRIGKIARLPKAVREELNRRLEDGEQQNRLVEWLNGRPDVQTLLNAEFDGRPINEPNMTAWAKGGYEDWRRQQETLGVAERLVEETAELGALTQGRLLADRAADLAALAIAEQLMAVRRMEEGEEKRRAILKLVRGLVRLRKTDREQERAQCEAERAQRARDYHQDWMENVRRPRKTGPFDDLSDAELIRRMEEMRALDAIAPRTDVTAFEDDDEEEDSPSPHSAGDDDGEQDDEELDETDDEAVGGESVDGKTVDSKTVGARSTELRANAAFGETVEIDVRARMAEVMERMSDEEIAESLRRSGHMQGTSTSKSTSKSTSTNISTSAENPP